MYIGGKESNKHESKRLKAGRGTVGKVPVVGVKDRQTNRITARPVTTTDRATLQGFVQDHVTAGAKVYTDEHRSYTGLANHETVKHSVGQYINGQIHTNGIESHWGAGQARLCRDLSPLESEALAPLRGRVHRPPQRPAAGHRGPDGCHRARLGATPAALSGLDRRWPGLSAASQARPAPVGATGLLAACLKASPVQGCGSVHDLIPRRLCFLTGGVRSQEERRYFRHASGRHLREVYRHAHSPARLRVMNEFTKADRSFRSWYCWKNRSWSRHGGVSKSPPLASSSRRHASTS